MVKLGRAVIAGYDALNKEGAPAFSLPLKERFVTRLMTCLVAEPKFYGDTTQDLVDEAKSLAVDDPVFVLKAAIYAREHMHLRTVPLILLRWLAASNLPSGQLVDGIVRVCTRPDQLVDLLAYYQKSQEPKAVDHGLRRGIARALEGYSEYQLAKYKPGLSRLIRLSHPKRSALFQSVIENTIEPPLTWEVELTRRGNTQEVWDDLIVKDAVPYMAMLRNLRNMAKVKATHMELVAERLADPERVKRSKQLPFRFLSAYRAAVEDVPKVVMEALEKAFELSGGNLPQFPGVTVIAADNSGSMQNMLSNRGSVSYADVANILMALSGSLSEAAILIPFGTTSAIVELPPGISTLGAIDHITKIEVGHGTNLHSVFDLLIERGIKADRVLVFSDMQSWIQGHRGAAQSSAEIWRREHSPGAWIHSVDLAGYGTSQFQGDNVSLIAGWSDRVLALMWAAEKGAGALVEDIEKGIRVEVEVEEDD